MAEIIEMDKRRRSLIARRGFESWKRRFTEAFDENTRLGDLPDAVLAVLIQPGEASSQSIYELVMGVKGLGPGPKFHYLDPSEKMEVMDITIFILDQLRFECMRRLGWIETYPSLNVPLVEMIDTYTTRFSKANQQTPPLSPSHSRYSEYEATYEADRGAFLRRLIPEALQAFSALVQT